MKNLQDLRERLIDESQDLKDILIDCLDELTPFAQGEYRGRIRELESICADIRNALKHHDCEYNAEVCLMCGETTEVAI